MVEKIKAKGVLYEKNQLKANARNGRFLNAQISVELIPKTSWHS